MDKPHNVIEYEARMANPAHELAVLESIFEQCQVAWWKGMQAIDTILEKKLWKSIGHKNEEEYLRKRWNIGVNQMYKRRQYAKIARELEDSLPEAVRLAHLASLGAYPADMRKEIMQMAMQTAPGGKMTAAWVEQTARRLMDARRAALKQEMQTAKRGSDPVTDDDEAEADIADEATADIAASKQTAKTARGTSEEGGKTGYYTEDFPADEEENEEEAAEGTGTDKTESGSPLRPTTEEYARRRSNRPGDPVLMDAVQHKILSSEEIDKLLRQCHKTGVKLHRLVTTLNWKGHACEMVDFLPK